MTAWLIAQVAGLAADSFGAPAWVMKMIITMLALGAPARVVRPVSDEEYRDQLERTRAYVQTAREHALSQGSS